MKNIVIIIASLLCCIIMICTTSCSSDDPTPNYGIVVSDLKFAPNGNGDNLTLSLKTDGNWKIESNSEWITFSAMQGTGNAEISMAVNPNYTSESRMSTLKLINHNGETVRTIPVSQKCSDATKPVIVCCNDLTSGSQQIDLSADWNQCDISFAPISVFSYENDLSSNFTASSWLQAQIVGSTMNLTYNDIFSPEKYDEDKEPTVVAANIILHKNGMTKKVTLLAGKHILCKASSAEVDNWGLENKISHRYVKELIVDLVPVQNLGVSICDRFYLPIYSLIPQNNEDVIPAGEYDITDSPTNNTDNYCHSFSWIPFNDDDANNPYNSLVQYGARHYSLFFETQLFEGSYVNPLTGREEYYKLVELGSGYKKGKVIVEKVSPEVANVYIIGCYRPLSTVQDTPNAAHGDRIVSFYEIQIDGNLVAD